MAHLRHVVFFMIATFAFVACEQSLPIDDIEVSRSVVVESIYSDDDTLLVRLVYSRSVFNSNQGFRPVRDAQVNIQCVNSGASHSLEELTEGAYILTGDHIQPGYGYLLTVETTDGERVEATSYIPAPIEVQINEILPVEDNGDEGLLIDFDIIDDESSTNYYVWDVITEDVPNAPGGITQQLGQWIRNGDNTTGGPIRFNTGSHWKIFSDDSALSGNTLNTSVVAFDGSDASSSGDTNDGGQVSTIDSSEVKLPTIHLRVQAVSRELYQYYQSLDRYYQFGAANTSFSDPAIIYSNVEGGHGIFAGFTETVIQVQ